MRVSHRVDYAVRAVVVHAGAQQRDPQVAMACDTIAALGGIPAGFLEHILRDLNAAGITKSRRGREGGSLLTRGASAITVADVVRALEAPGGAARAGGVHLSTEEEMPGPVAPTWRAASEALRAALDSVTLAELAMTRDVR